MEGEAPPFKSVKLHLHLATRERRGLPRFSSSEYREALRSLLELGLVRKVKAYICVGRPMVLLEAPGTRPGTVHRFLERRATVVLAAMGAEPVRLGDANIAARICGARVAVEAETRSNINASKYLKLHNLCEAVVVFCSTKDCIRVVRDALNASGWPGCPVVMLSGFPSVIRLPRRCLYSGRASPVMLSRPHLPGLARCNTARDSYV